MPLVSYGYRHSLPDVAFRPQAFHEHYNVFIYSGGRVPFLEYCLEPCG